MNAAKFLWNIFEKILTKMKILCIKIIKILEIGYLKNNNKRNNNPI